MSSEFIPDINIGLVGHVDHGKTTLVAGITGQWTDRHSEEIKRGISIRLGYADATVYKCPNCEGADAYSSAKVCPHCGAQLQTTANAKMLSCDYCKGSKK